MWAEGHSGRSSDSLSLLRRDQVRTSTAPTSKLKEASTLKAAENYAQYHLPMERMCLYPFLPSSHQMEGDQSGPLDGDDKAKEG